MKHIENVMHGGKSSSTGYTQKFSETLRYMERKFLKRIVINLPPTKDSEINLKFLSDVQNHVLYTGPNKIFLIYYGLCLEKAGNIFPSVFHDF